MLPVMLFGGYSTGSTYAERIQANYCHRNVDEVSLHVCVAFLQYDALSEMECDVKPQELVCATRGQHVIAAQSETQRTL